jgi:hypothetical protein
MILGAVCSGESLQVMRDWSVPPWESEESLKGEGVMNQEGWVRKRSEERSFVDEEVAAVGEAEPEGAGKDEGVVVVLDGGHSGERGTGEDVVDGEDEDVPVEVGGGGAEGDGEVHDWDGPVGEGGREQRGGFDDGGFQGSHATRSLGGGGRVGGSEEERRTEERERCLFRLWRMRG